MFCQNNLYLFFKALGPGILYAGAAIGVSHLVNATKAGSLFGYYLFFAIILIHIIKYPFFEIATRYTSSTGKTLLEGYQEISHWAFYTVILLTLLSMFIIQATVTLVTVDLFQEITGLITPALWQGALIILAICGGILIIGHYKLLDSITKTIMLLLTVCTTMAVIIALLNSSSETVNNGLTAETFSWQSSKHLLFLVVFLGWMPAPFDVSIWQSIWTKEKKHQLHDPNTNNLYLEKQKPSFFKKALLDFHIGYWGTMILACLFFILGAEVLYNTNNPLSDKGLIFAKQFISIYVSTLGEWSYWVIGIAATTTMFSTTLTCLDGFSRVMSTASNIILSHKNNSKTETLYLLNSYGIWTLITILGSLIILTFFTSNMGTMIKVATTLAFITAPILAFFNYIVMTRTKIPLFAKMNNIVKIIAIIFIKILFIGAILYLILVFT